MGGVGEGEERSGISDEDKPDGDDDGLSAYCQPCPVAAADQPTSMSENDRHQRR